MKAKINVPAVSPETVAKLNEIAGRKGNRAAAFAVLNRACHRATAGAGLALSLADLPDLPCIMNAADEIESIFDSDWIGVCTVEQANEIAAEAVAELLAEEGFDMEGCE
jgi:hypothetical protein